jgi:hypothetical protein
MRRRDASSSGGAQIGTLSAAARDVSALNIEVAKLQGLSWKQIPFWKVVSCISTSR